MTVRPNHEWRWCCVRCMDSGRADSAVHAVALTHFHEGYACPATAPDQDEFDRRMMWRRMKVLRYGTAPYDRPWRTS